MSSEWMKVMLEEIARKKAEAEQAQQELDRRRDAGLGRDGSAGGEPAGGGPPDVEAPPR
jgi:hypothetical protein